jgi:hypothetical protein
MDANPLPAPSFDDLLRQVVEAHKAAQDDATRTVEELEARIITAREVAREATERFHAQLADLAQRKLAGEFKEEEGVKAVGRHERRSAGYGETEKQVESACRTLPTPGDFIAAEAEQAYAKLFPELPAIKRGTLNGSLGRLVERGVLYVVEAGYKRRSTRYGFSAPKVGAEEEVSE